MSVQKGNANRTRAQKYQNRKAFKNNLHDTSHTTKNINNLQITDVCERCKGVLLWKIKYKKYKPLKNPSVCCKCSNKCVKHAYHIMCDACSRKLSVCPKCGIVEMKRNDPENLSSDLEEKCNVGNQSRRKPSIDSLYVESEGEDNETDDSFDFIDSEIDSDD